MTTGAELKSLAEKSPSGGELKALAEGDSPVKEFGSQFSRGVGESVGMVSRFIDEAATVVSPLGRMRDFGAVDKNLTLGKIISTMTGLPEPKDIGKSFPFAAQEEPDSIAGSAGRMAGTAASMVFPVGGAASTVARSAAVGGNLLQRLGRFARNLTSDIGQTVVKSPKTALAVETGLGASAGAGGYIAKEKFPDSDSAEFIGEIVGGVLPSLTPTGLAIRGASFLRGHVSTFRRGMKRAEERIDRALPEEARQIAIRNLDAPAVVDPKTGRPVLSLAQRTGDKGLLSLEKSVVEASEQLTRASDEQIANANQVIQDAAKSIGGGDVAKTNETIKDAQNYLSSLLDTRVRIAARSADEKIAALAPNSTPEQANRIVTDELGRVVKAGRAQERELYDAVLEETAVPYSKVLNVFQQTIKDTGRAQQGDIPAIAKKMLSPKSKASFQQTGQETTIKEIRALQSKLREKSRIARANKQFNAARIADNLADAITDDIEGAVVEGASEAVKIAVGFSRALNERLSRGTVGRLLGNAKEGGQKIPAGLTLETAIGGGGPKAREALDDIAKAFDSPEAPSSKATIAATTDYLKNKFIKAAEGGINSAKVKSFMQTHEELLTRLPGLRKQFDDAVNAGNVVALRERQASRVSFDPKVSKATMFIQKGPKETFKEIASLPTKEAAAEAKKLVNLASRDKTGEALSGLKSSFVDSVMFASKEPTRDVKGIFFASGFKLQDQMNNPSIRAVMNGILDKGEIERLSVITQDLIKLETRRAAKGAKEGVLGDVTGNVLESIAGVAGAAVGRRAAALSGSGGTVQIPGIMAQRFRAMTRFGIEDPAKRVITDSIEDEALFREFLQSRTKNGVLGKTASKRFNIWATAVLAEKAGGEEPEQQKGIGLR